MNMVTVYLLRAGHMNMICRTLKFANAHAQRMFDAGYCVSLERKLVPNLNREYWRRGN